MNLIESLNLNVEHYNGDFIEYFDNKINDSKLKDIISFFEENKDFYSFGKEKGILKIDIDYLNTEEGRYKSQFISRTAHNIFSTAIMLYKKKIQLERKGHIGIESGNYEISCYLKNKGYIKAKNFEYYCKEGKKSDIICIIFLNDSYIGGDIEFKYINKKILAKKGRILCFPNIYNYSYKENKPITNNKYSIVNWFRFVKTHASKMDSKKRHASPGLNAEKQNVEVYAEPGSENRTNRGLGGKK